MTVASDPDLRGLIERLARLGMADAWADDLNPTQTAALRYLDRANRFSGSPSHLADYLGATRGTVSQTLRSLLKKGYVSEQRLETDKRQVRFQLTDRGRQAARRRDELDQALDALPDGKRRQLSTGLGAALGALIDRRGGKGFGICHSCSYHEIRPEGAFCTLIGVPLSADDAGRICHEHRPPDAA